MSASEEHFLNEYNVHDFDVPLTSVDICIFSIFDGVLKVLSVERKEYPFKGLWALPGGFIDLSNDDDLDFTAHRKLVEKTGVKASYLEQVETLGNATRDPRGWSVTILYYALLDSNMLSQASLTDEAHWLSLEELSSVELAFDHNVLVQRAYSRLKSKTCYTALPLELMPEVFTLTECQKVFEIILEKRLPVKSFRKRMLDAEIVEPTGLEKRSGKRNAALFKSSGITREYFFSRPLKL